MKKFVVLGVGAAAAAAAAVVGLLVGAQLFGSPSDGVGTDSTPSPASSVESTLLTNSEPTDSYCIDLDAGTYHAVIGTLTVRMTVPAEWSWSSYAQPGDETFMLRARSCIMGSAQNLEFWLVDRVYADACNLGGTVETDTPAALTAALAAQTGHETAGPSEATLGGYPANRFEFSFPVGSVPDGPCAGDPAVLFSRGQGLFGDPLTVYVVDVGGTALAVIAISPEAEMDAIIDSLVIEP